MSHDVSGLTMLGRSTAQPNSPEEAVLERVPNPHPGTHYVARFTAPEFTSLCPVTGQPDWASLHLRYRGPRIDRAGLLRYIVSFREHAGFHEQCVEQIFLDVLHRCRPVSLSVEARYTRRGGLDVLGDRPDRRL